MLRHLAYGALVAAFAVFAVRGIGGWTEPASPGRAAAPSGDEIPLRTGFLKQPDAVRKAFRGYPFEKFRADLIAARRELPDDPAEVGGEDQLKRNEKVASVMRFEFPHGDFSWAEIRKRLPACTKEYDLEVYFPEPQPPDTLMISVPKVVLSHGQWQGFTFFSFLRGITQDQVDALVTAEGIAVGTQEACTRADRASRLVGLRRRVLRENADPRLDVTCRPDVVDADFFAFLQTLESQTGIPIVAEATIWDRMFGLAWRGEPRKLRDAMDELCAAFKLFWRFKDGRIYVMQP